MIEPRMHLQRSPTIRYDTDCCPACASTDAQPYAIIVGASELYGYLCLACGVSWPVIQTSKVATPKRPMAAERRFG